MGIGQGSLAVEDRLRWLSDRLVREDAVTIAAAAGELDVSEMTIRRDLAELEQRGLARRVRGGAKAVGPQTFEQRRGRAATAKRRIAAKLAGLVPGSGLVAFDASSTILRLATSLPDVRDLRVLTHSPQTFESLRHHPGVTGLLTGGQLDERTGSLVGPLACRTADQLRVDVLFASAAAVDPEGGTFETTLEEADVKRAIAAGAARVVLAVDAAKLGARAEAAGLDWDRIDTLVTELDVDDDRLAPYRSRTTLL